VSNWMIRKLVCTKADSGDTLPRNSVFPSVDCALRVQRTADALIYSLGDYSPVHHVDWLFSFDGYSMSTPGDTTKPIIKSQSLKFKAVPSNSSQDLGTTGNVSATDDMEAIISTSHNCLSPSNEDYNLNESWMKYVTHLVYLSLQSLANRSGCAESRLCWCLGRPLVAPSCVPCMHLMYEREF
jgi:hypothetical protein